MICQNVILASKIGFFLLQLLVIEESKWKNCIQCMLYCAADLQAHY